MKETREETYRKELTIIRNKLYDNLPTGEVNSFDLITIIKLHLKELDFFIDYLQPVTDKEATGEQENRDCEACMHTMLPPAIKPCVGCENGSNWEQENLTAAEKEEINEGYRSLDPLFEGLEQEIDINTPFFGNSGAKVPVLTDLLESDKASTIDQFVRMTAKHTLQLFMMLGLKTHITAKVKNDATNEEFEFTFKKLEQEKPQTAERMTLDLAEKLAKQTDYACEATHTDINPINWGDAAAFFLEGYEYATQKHIPTDERDSLKKFLVWYCDNIRERHFDDDHFEWVLDEYLTSPKNK